MAEIDLDVPIPPHRLVALRKAGLRCTPSEDWLKDGKTYADLAENPHWAFLAARVPGADVERLQAVVIRWGTPELRKKFSAHVRGADAKLLLSL